MGAAVLRTLDLLISASSMCRDARVSAVSILGVSLDSPVARALTESDATGVWDRYQILLREVCRMAAGHKTNQSLTDWPFENFWGNPYEPRHSKLIGYFINPLQEHGCGQFLLSKFLEVLGQSLSEPGHAPHRFASENCRVFPESEYIDLCIERTCEDQRFAIIIENKVNSAADQNQQLQRYVDHVHKNHGFAYHEIYVFYLPLTGDKHPDRFDRAWVESRAHYKQITFESEILRWLDSALSDFDFEQKEGMRENLAHYRNLIRYLNRKQKEIEMDARILTQLQEAETKSPLPTLADLDTLQQSLAQLRRCVQHVLRGKLLLAIRDALQRNGQDAWMCLEKDPLQKAEISSPFDTAFGSSTNVCIRVSDAVHVCFGGSHEHKFWLGYLRDGSSEQQKKINSIILQEAAKQLAKIETDDSTWYAWAWRDGLYDENDGENSAAAISKRLLAMQTSLVQRFDSMNTKG